jgi:very-short-patch-repair endonuclease
MTAPRSDAEVLLAVQLSQASIYYEREVLFARPRKWRADFLVQPGDLLIEVEGGLYVQGRHSRGAGFEADLEKYNAAAELGYTVLRFSPRMVNDGSALAQIRRILSMKEEAA